MSINAFLILTEAKCPPCAMAYKFLNPLHRLPFLVVITSNEMQLGSAFQVFRAILKVTCFVKVNKSLLLYRRV